MENADSDPVSLGQSKDPAFQQVQRWTTFGGFFTHSSTNILYQKPERGSSLTYPDLLNEKLLCRGWESAY